MLDLGLPRQDGLDSLKAVRARRVATPVLVLTARDALPSRIEGLDAGADDYLIKPVDLLALAARLRALVRRAHGQLSGREYDLLHVLLLNAGRVLTEDQLEQHLYPWGSEVASNAVQVHVYHLRRKLRPGLIQTVRGVGYMLQREAQP